MKENTFLEDGSRQRCIILRGAGDVGNAESLGTHAREILRKNVLDYVLARNMLPTLGAGDKIRSNDPRPRHLFVREVLILRPMMEGRLYSCFYN